jgi:hypothetical protein
MSVLARRRPRGSWSESGVPAPPLVAGLSELADRLLRLLFGLRLI